MINNQYHTLRLILGDQLNAKHSWYTRKDSQTLYVIAELHQEMQYVTHHIQKICAFFSSMENFHKALKKSQHDCLHLTLDDTQKFNTLEQLIISLVKKYKVTTFEYQEPDEYRLQHQLDTISNNLSNININTKIYSTEHFFIKKNEIPQHFSKEKNNLMENFYRKMRKKFNYLMDNMQPEQGQWNYDEKNRNKLKNEDIADIPSPLLFKNDIADVLKRIKKHKVKTIGQLHPSNTSSYIFWPTNRLQARELLNFFCHHCLPLFGTFQDAMTTQSEHKWSLYHSRISFALNSKMLSPKEVVDTAIDEYKKNKSISIAQIEGFIRQIIGWREFIRGIYWTFMPNYSALNHLDASIQLPNYFWSGDTKMHCMQQTINQSLKFSYAHHIQRLMITGNFCLIAGIQPDEVEQWYMGIYIDAIEWVEMPNTRGMSQFADGGIVGSKPYAASGNYINKQSDYCKNCYYNVKERETEKSCPMNSLYWHFMHRHRQILEKNPRIGFAYRTLDKMEEKKRQNILARGDWCIKNIDSL